MIRIDRIIWNIIVSTSGTLVWTLKKTKSFIHPGGCVPLKDFLWARDGIFCTILVGARDGVAVWLADAVTYSSIGAFIGFQLTRCIISMSF